MIRFRRIEDETRYGVLRTELISMLVPLLPATTLNAFLRNYGKLETLLHVEGMRQGVAAAALGEMMDKSPATRDAQVHPKSLKAFQLHAAIYGSADSPLREAEKALLRRMSLPEDFLAASWLDDQPMHFEPLSLQELGVTAPPSIPMHKVTLSEPLPDRLPVVGEPPPRSVDPRIAAELGDDDSPELSPMFIDRVREVLIAAMKDGWRPEAHDNLSAYDDILMKVHMTIGADPSYTDIELSTEMGRTMLMQVGITDIAPPAQVDANAMFTFVEFLEARSSEATPATDGDQQSDSPKSE